MYHNRQNSQSSVKNEAVHKINDSVSSSVSLLSKRQKKKRCRITGSSVSSSSSSSSCLGWWYLLLVLASNYSIEITLTATLLGSWAVLAVVDAASFLPLHQRGPIQTSASLLMATTAAAGAASGSNSNSPEGGGAQMTTTTTGSSLSSVAPPPPPQPHCSENWRVFPKDACNDAEATRRALSPPQGEESRCWSPTCYQQGLDLYEQLATCDDSYISQQIQHALQTLHDAYRLYGATNVVCSFNGGKDASVILELLRAVHAKHYQGLLLEKQSTSSSTTSSPSSVFMHRPRAVYWDKGLDEFSQVSDFVRDRARAYDLDLLVFEKGIAFSRGLQILVDYNQPSAIVPPDCDMSISPETWSKIQMQLPTMPMAFVLGTRSGDPNSIGQATFCPSSSSYMPPFMRVNPILHWNYGHVWQFLRAHALPTCCLYECGYTSLGNVHDTVRNPALYVPPAVTTTDIDDNTNNNNANGTLIEGGKYRPAWMLTDYTLERAGRISKKLPNQKSDAGAAAAAAAATTMNKETTLSRGNSSLTNFSTMSQIDRAVVALSSEAVPRVVATTLETGAAAADNKAAADQQQPSDADDIVSFCSDTETQRTVGLLIIGDEILKGYTVDTNSQAAATALRNQNVLLKRVVVVSDDLQEIADEIVRLQHDVDVIITSGGVGPTHDDVTIKSVAAALNLEMTLHQEMAELLIEKMNSKNEAAPTSTDRTDANTTTTTTTTTTTDSAEDKNGDDDADVSSQLTQAQIKMATLPRKSKLRYLSKTSGDWPVLQCGNIFVLPGVPEYFAAKIVNVASYLCCQWERSAQYKVVLSVDENAIVNTLNQIVDQHPNVTFGSYPFVDHPDRKTVITVEGKLLTHPQLQQQEEEQDQRQKQQTLSSTTTNKPRRNSVVFDPSQIDTSKVVMDRYVQLALDDLLESLPAGSVLRVDNDMLLFN